MYAYGVYYGGIKGPCFYCYLITHSISNIEFDRAHRVSISHIEFDLAHRIHLGHRFPPRTSNSTSDIDFHLRHRILSRRSIFEIEYLIK